MPRRTAVFGNWEEEEEKEEKEGTVDTLPDRNPLRIALLLMSLEKCHTS